MAFMDMSSNHGRYCILERLHFGEELARMLLNHPF